MLSTFIQNLRIFIYQNTKNLQYLNKFNNNE